MTPDAPATPSPPAVLLAAGTGSRLRDVVGERPKALLEVGGKTLLARSLDALRSAGVERLVTVVGYRRELLEDALARAWPGAELVDAPDYRSTGSMRSLALAVEHCPDGALLLESDLIYEPRAVTRTLSAPADDVVLVSPPTGAGDEVWVCGDEHRIREIGKEPSKRWPRRGELVGILRLSGPTLREMAARHFDAGDAAAREHYEERLSALVAPEDGVEVRWFALPGLAWGEIDDPNHLRRVRDEVLPALEPSAVNHATRHRARGGPRPNLLFTPGPANTSDGVRGALARGDECPREGDFAEVVRRVRRKLLRVLGVSAGSGDGEGGPPGGDGDGGDGGDGGKGGGNGEGGGDGDGGGEGEGGGDRGGPVADAPGVADDWTAVLLAGSGTAAVEATLTTLVPPGGCVLVLENGAYGRRAARILELHGIAHETHRTGWDRPLDPEVVAEVADGTRFSHLFLVHHETTSGVLNPLAALARLGRSRGLVTVVDAMSSFGGIPLDDALPDLDAVVSSSNKCVQGAPGLSFLLARSALLEPVPHPPRSLYLDLRKARRSLDTRGHFPFTPPVQVVWALVAALDELGVVSVGGRRARFDACYERVMRWAGRAGLVPLADTDTHSRLLTAFLHPDRPDFDFGDFHDRLRERGVTIYPGKVPERPSFRIATMGALGPDEVERGMRIVAAELAPRADDATRGEGPGGSPSSASPRAREGGSR